MDLLPAQLLRKYKLLLTIKLNIYISSVYLIQNLQEWMGQWVGDVIEWLII